MHADTVGLRRMLRHDLFPVADLPVLRCLQALRSQSTYGENMHQMVILIIHAEHVVQSAWILF